MTNELNCTHFTFVNCTMCKSCGRLQCDLCKKEHKLQHMVNNDQQLSREELGASAEEVEARKTKRLFFIGLAIGIPVILFGHFGANFLGVTFSGSDESVYISFACVSVIQLWIGKRFYIGAYKMAKMKSANMDTLIVLGTTTAYVFSVTNTFPAPIWENIHYEASVMVIVFILLGKYLENKTKG